MRRVWPGQDVDRQADRHGPAGAMGDDRGGGRRGQERHVRSARRAASLLLRVSAKQRHADGLSADGRQSGRAHGSAAARGAGGRPRPARLWGADDGGGGRALARAAPVPTADDRRVRGDRAAAGGARHLRRDGVLGESADAGDRHSHRAGRARRRRGRHGAAAGTAAHVMGRAGRIRGRPAALAPAAQPTVRDGLLRPGDVYRDRSAAAGDRDRRVLSAARGGRRGWIRWTRCARSKRTRCPII